jgi:hypothetical protein
MSGIQAADAITILAIFLGGIFLGVIVVVSVAIKKEDRKFSLSGAAPGVAARGARMLTGFGSRGPRIWER